MLLPHERPHQPVGWRVGGGRVEHDHADTGAPAGGQDDRGAPMVDQDGLDPVAGLGSELVDQEVGRLGDPVVEGAVRQLDPLVPVVVVPGEQGLSP